MRQKSSQYALPARPSPSSFSVLLAALPLITGCGEQATPGTEPSAGSAGQASLPTAGAGGSTVSGTGGSDSSAGGTGNVAGATNLGGSSSGGSSGGSGAGGSAGGGNQGGAGPMNKVFSECRFHFGTIDSVAKQTPALIPELDFFTPGWMGLSDTFDQAYVCEEGNEGGVLSKQVPVIVAYVSAFYVKRHHGELCDCNVNECGDTDGKPNDLCHFGAQYIKQDLAKIIEVYESYARGYAQCYGTTRPIVFEMEPDWYQYTGSTQGSPMTKQESASIIGQYVDAIRKHLPNAHFSIDISPWVDDNGGTNGQSWYSHFDLSKFTFANTSGGSTLAASAKIRNENQMTWAGVSQVTGKGVLADTGYGANGVSAGHDPHWDDANNVNQRIADGVLSISQYNPNPDWVDKIKSMRGQLAKPKFCP